MTANKQNDVTAKTRKARTSTAPKGETKAAKFVRLGEARVTKAVKALRNLAKLGGTGYENTDEQRAAIEVLLAKEVAAINKALMPKVKAEKGAAESVIKL